MAFLFELRSMLQTAATRKSCLNKSPFGVLRGSMSIFKPLFSGFEHCKKASKS